MMKRISFLLVVLFAVVLNGCLKSTNGPASPNPAGMFIIQASPNAPATDVYIGGQLSLTNIPYGTDTGYAYALPGTYEFKIAETGKSTYYVTKSFLLDTARLYSIYFIDSLSKMKVVQVQDGFAIPDSDSAQVRYLDFSPNLILHTVKFTNIATNEVYQEDGRFFNDQSANTYRQYFKTLKAGKYNIDFYLLGNGTAFKTISNFDLKSGKAFTIYMKGFYGGTGTQALDYGVIQHLL